MPASQPGWRAQGPKPPRTNLPKAGLTNQPNFKPVPFRPNPMPSFPPPPGWQSAKHGGRTRRQSKSSKSRRNRRSTRRH